MFSLHITSVYILPQVNILKSASKSNNYPLSVYLM